MLFYSLFLILTLYTNSIISSSDENPPKFISPYSFENILPVHNTINDINNLNSSFEGNLNFELYKLSNLFKLEKIITLNKTSNSLQCYEDFRKYQIEWIDASGKIPPAVLGGALNWPGSMEMCYSIPYLNKNTTNMNNVRGKYCDLFFKIEVPPPIGARFEFDFNIGLCIPDSCNPTELLKNFLNSALAKHLTSVKINNTYCRKRINEVEKDRWYWIALIMIGYATKLMLVGSIIDLIYYFKWYSKLKSEINLSHDNDNITSDLNMDESNGPKTMKVNINQLYNHNDYIQLYHLKYRSQIFNSKKKICLLLITAFSFFHNFWYLWKPKINYLIHHKLPYQTEHPLQFLHGIRSITMLWLVYAQMILVFAVISNNVALAIHNHIGDWTAQVIVNGSLSVDVFFFMSGFLSAYRTLQNIHQCHGVRNKIRFWSCYIFHRFIRLTPAYLFVLVIYIGLFRLLSDGFINPQTTNNYLLNPCHHHWWITYLNNFFYTDEMCMEWSWYLSNDFQFSVVLVPIFITLVLWNKYLGLLFIMGLLSSSIGITYHIAFIKNYLPGGLALDAFTDIYIKPYTRWSTYAIGLLLGWICESHLDQFKQPTRLRKTIFIIICILLSSTFSLSTVYGLYGTLSKSVGPLSNTTSALFTAVFRPVFILGVALFVLLCVLDYVGPIKSLLSWYLFRVTSQINYGVYLIHPIVIIFFLIGAKAPFLIDYSLSIIIFFGIMVMSYVTGSFIYLIIERPFINLETVIKQYRISRN